jgi:Tfp pilus assembly protein PilX
MRAVNDASPIRATGKPGEAGSAYIAVLLVLVVLTILALAISLITQTETQIGSNERTVNRVFYAADAGTQAGLAQVLVSRDFRGHTYLLTDTGLQLIDAKLQYGTQVTVSDFSKVQEGPCNLCEINQAGTYGGKEYTKSTYAFTSTASRFATINMGTAKTPLAQETIEAMFQIHPIAPTIVDTEKNSEAFKK